jgi:hypothetical protein
VATFWLSCVQLALPILPLSGREPLRT